MSNTNMHVVFNTKDVGQDYVAHVIEEQEVAFARHLPTGLFIWSFEADAQGIPLDDVEKKIVGFMAKNWNEEVSKGCFIEVLNDQQLKAREDPKALVKMLTGIDLREVIIWAEGNIDSLPLLQNAMVSLRQKQPRDFPKENAIRKVFDDAMKDQAVANGANTTNTPQGNGGSGPDAGDAVQKETVLPTGASNVPDATAGAPGTPTTPDAAAATGAPAAPTAEELNARGVRMYKDGSDRNGVEAMFGRKLSSEEWDGIKNAAETATE